MMKPIVITRLHSRVGSETVEESVRLASATKTPTEVIPYGWYLVNNYWQVCGRERRICIKPYINVHVGREGRDAYSLAD